MDVRRLVGRNLQLYRKRLGVSQEELAFRAGLHRTYVSGVERGVRNPTVVILGRLAKALTVSLQFCFLPSTPKNDARRRVPGGFTFQVGATRGRNCYPWITPPNF